MPKTIWNTNSTRWFECRRGVVLRILFTFCYDSLFSLIFLIILYLPHSIPRTFHLPLLFFPLFYIYFTRPREHCLIILTHSLTHPCLSLYISSYPLYTI